MSISSTANQVIVDGAYKTFTSASGSTKNVINFGSGDAPTSADASRFLLWKVTSGSFSWQIRYIESATDTEITIGDGGFTDAPSNGASFIISYNLEDIYTAINDETIVKKAGSHYEFVNREWKITNEGFLADVDKSLQMTNTTGGSSWQIAFPVEDKSVVQFGRLLGGENNDSVETTQGCRLHFSTTKKDKLVFSRDDEEKVLDGHVLNFYGCHLESTNSPRLLFIRASGALRLIGCICDGKLGGRFYNSYSELVDTRLSGNRSEGNAWSMAITLGRAITNTFFYDNVSAIKSWQSFDASFLNCRFSDTNDIIVASEGAGANLNYRFVNSTTFEDSQISENIGSYTQEKSIKYFLADSNGVGLDNVLVAVYDKNEKLQSEYYALSNDPAVIDSMITSSSSGQMNPIYCTFFNKLHGQTAENLAPFTIRVRKYGYTFLGFSSAVTEQIDQEIRLVINPDIVATEAEAENIAGIDLDFASSQLTINANVTPQNIYDFYQYKLHQKENMKYAEQFTKTGDAFNFDDWNVTITNCAYIGNMETSGSVTIDNADYGGTIVDSSGTRSFGSYQIKNLVSGSRVQVYNVTENTEVFNDIVDDTTLAKSFITEMTEGDSIRIRVAYQNSVIAKEPQEIIATCTTPSWEVTANQQDALSYNEFALDGTSVSEIALDIANGKIEVDITDGDNATTIQRIGAFYYSELMTSDGISNLFGAINWLTANQISIDQNKVDLKIDNKKSEPLILTGGRLYRLDDSTIISSTSNSVQIDYSPVYIANAPLISEINKNTKLIPALL